VNIDQVGLACMFDSHFWDHMLDTFRWRQTALPIRQGVVAEAAHLFFMLTCLL
jgi:hypothetical protein